MNIVEHIKIFCSNRQNVENNCALIANLKLVQALSFYSTLARECITANSLVSLKQYTEAISICIQKSQHNNIAKAIDIFSTVDQILYYNQLSRILLIKSIIDNELYDEIENYLTLEDETESLYLRTTYHFLKQDYYQALRHYNALCERADYPNLLHAILQEITLDYDTKSYTKKLINKLCSRKNYSMYFQAINQYIRRLYTEQEIGNTDDIEEYCSKNKINFILLSDILFHNEEYEQCYDLILDNIHKTSTFFPACLWLLKSAQYINQLENLYSLITNMPNKNKAHTQLLDSITETLDRPSSRLYRNTIHNDSLVQNIMFCVNNSYLRGFKAAINSLAINATFGGNNMHVYVFIDNTINLDDITQHMSSHTLKYTIYNIDNIYNTHHVKIDYGVATNHKLDRSAYYRIFGLKFLIDKYQLKKLLYLDSDILVMSPVYQLFNIQENYPLYGVLEDENQLMVKRSKQLNNITHYINSGVLLFNTQNTVFSKSLEDTINAVTRYNNLILHDQCAINIGFNNNIYLLDKRYNFTLHNNDLCAMNQDIDILHFTGITKPWQATYHNNELLSKLWYTFYKASNGSTNI